jgi:hypothetical protein
MLGVIAIAAFMLGGRAGGSPGMTYEDLDYQGSTFDEVWSQVTSDPYGELPHYRVTVTSFFHYFTNRLLSASRRTLNSHADIRPWFPKLLHPNGICMAGRWHITEENPYSGYFRAGSEGMIIARASTALSETRQDQYRVFALAGKIYPTTNRYHFDLLRPANFVVIEDLGGRLRRHYLDAEQTNDIIGISVRPSSVFQGPLAFTVASSFARADETFDVTQTLERQLYPIAELAEDGPTVAPRWMKITGAQDTPRVDRLDFRDELAIEGYPEGILFDISVADEGTRLGPKRWHRIGYIHITETVASDSCDHRLHFHHPRFRR